MSVSVQLAKKDAGKKAMKELTLRGIIIGGIITLVFTAANVYLGLKVGMTFATSIPAAVISMAILRFFKDHTVIENNIVQTIASAAGTLSAIIFVLPGLVIIGHWNGFPYWTTACVCAIGGILGVMYSIPLRRALVVGSNLPYPEGVAAAEVLKVGDTASATKDNQRGLQVIIVSAISSVLVAIVGQTKIVASSFVTAIRVGSGGTLIGVSLSMALIGVGHLVGLTVAIGMTVGMVITYFVLLPMHTAGHVPSSGDIAGPIGDVFKHDVRFIGAGAIAIAALWALFKIMMPIVQGIKESILATRAKRQGEQVERTERDLPMTTVIGVIFASVIPIGLLLWIFTQQTPDIAGNPMALVMTSIIFILIVGLFVAAVCGYMAGLVGASNSPISSVGILVVLAGALLYSQITHSQGPEDIKSIVAYTLFSASIVFGIATISNDNLQDLKTGQLVRATPWKQQVALIIGVIFGSLIIPPVLDVMQNAFGFVGAPQAGPSALAAPQASLVTSLAMGVFGGTLNWGLIATGAVIGAVVIAVNGALSHVSKRQPSWPALALPPLSVGMGMYLPSMLTIMIPIGALLGYLYNRWASKRSDPEQAKRMGTLLATGLIVGESLFGVVFAAIVAGSGVDEPLAMVGDGFSEMSKWLGVVVFAGVLVLLYRWVRGVSVGAEQEEDDTVTVVSNK